MKGTMMNKETREVGWVTLEFRRALFGLIEFDKSQSRKKSPPPKETKHDA